MKYIAHRGKTDNALENTIEAFIAAANDPHFDGIECDIYTTQDKEFVIHHDHTLERFADMDDQIMDLTYDEIKNIKLYDKNSNVYHIPHLVEFLDICKKHQKRPIVEIKKIHDISLLHNLLVLLEDYEMINPMIISFDLNYLKYLRTSSTLDLYYLTNEITDEMMYDCRVNEINFYINKESVCKQTITTLKKKGFLIGVFTVNDKKTEELCKSLELDYITTDKL